MNTDPSQPPADTLASALARHQLILPKEQQKQINHYVKLLWEWNEKINLTRHTDYEKFVARDLVDTLELAKLLHSGEEALDVGTGGGVPGLLLAILRPDLSIHLCDSVGKKARAVEAMAKQLDVPVCVYATRAEEQLPHCRYDAVFGRAVGPLWKMLEWFRPHWAYIGRLLLIKGPKWPEELLEAKRRALMAKLEIRTAAEYPMAGSESKSVILKLWHKGTRER